MTGPTAPLRLAAETSADLQVLSAAVQDAVGLVGDMISDAKARRFSLTLNRFRWERAGRRGPYERVRSVLSFEGVAAVRARNLRREPKDAAAVLLAVQFFPDAEPPGGQIRVTFAGDGELRLTVEALDAVLVDLGAAWPTPHRPDHDAPRPKPAAQARGSQE